MMGALGSMLPLLLLPVFAAAPHSQLPRAGAAEARFGECCGRRGGAGPGWVLTGCLFEDDLCQTFEICINDGAFGRCQRVPVIDVYKYEISPPILQHLRIILEKLSHRGFTWQDDYMQHVIALELSNIRKIHHWHPDSFISDGSDTLRTSKWSAADNERNYELEKDVDLAKSLQQYLAYLGILSQSAAPNLYPRMKNDKASVKGNIQPDLIIDYMMQQSKGKAPALTHQQYAENPAMRTFNQPQLENFPPESDAELDRNALISALHAYVAQKMSARNNDKSSIGRTKWSHLYANRFHSSQTGHFDGTLAREETEDFKMKQPFLRRPGAVVLGPSSEMLTYKSASPQGDPKDPLNAVDETFIQDILKDLKKNKVNMDNLSPLELDEMADIIADAIQVVDVAEEKQNGAGKFEGERPKAEVKEVDAQRGVDYETGLMDAIVNMQDNRGHEEDARADKKENNLGVKRMDFSNENALTENLPNKPTSEDSFKTETKKSEDSDSSSSSEEEIKVGVENVKSETFSRELAAEKKTESEPDTKELTKIHYWIKNSLMRDESAYEEPQKKTGEGLQLEVKSSEEKEYGYIVTEKDILGPAVTFKMHSNVQNITTADVAKAADVNKYKLEKATGLKILQTGLGEKSKLKLLPHRTAEDEDSTKFIILTLLSIACIIGVLVASGVLYCLRHQSHHRLKEKLSALGTDTSSDATAAYQELCRQRMAVKSSDRPEPLHTSRVNSVSSQFSDGPVASPSARSSTSSWCEEPVQSNMDISTGHMILSYMEDHLKNKNRLEKEWEALCAYQAEPSATTIAQKEENVQKNRSQSVVTYDHSRICLKAENSHDNSDYINASPIMDHDPRNPAYIATQGPLPATVADFWQMVWENGCVVIVMLTPLTENGVKQCYHYWPDEGSNLYHIYEVNLVSEHIWCEDFLVRSFYLKNLQTNETRTVTQFHFLSWHDQKVPASTRSLLDFRRKVNKCYRGRSCPVIVHCSDGAGRSGTYILIDMVLNKMAKGAKEIDIAATLEHLRDQRPGMVQTKEQFEFTLTAVAEEVNAILKALPQ
ncbi:receptor-type tyrosine-protein phosphatase N2 isoform X3 [Gopherus flavomarginatus]|uniref:receptor-type tyrosine-protein phosphatase N2 isoform X3 n=1 Tax=Gopherus flavomarginatus TaxID=286002 RepID=UPI0021CC403E|nr:receptor-type tyrosine-protein phosphatase N2 isoform X3 [Gopherus flavomarginatus]